MSASIFSQGIPELLAFLSSFDNVTARRGKTYFKNGAVLNLLPSEVDDIYLAVVRGGEDYEEGRRFRTAPFLK